MLTAHGSIASAKEAMRRGLADYLTKPFSPSDLLKAIEKCERVLDERERLSGQSDGKTDEQIIRELQEAIETLERTSPAAGIKRSITFPPEFKEAGVSILGYFSHVLAVKYPDIDVGVTIEQLGNRVTLIVATPEGEKERIERELNNYGLVVKGQLTPDQYFDSPREVMALEHKLELAALEVRQTKDMLYSERRQYDARIHSLERHMETLGNVLSMDRRTNLELIRALREIAKESSRVAAESINNIIKGIQKGITEDDRDFITRQLLTIRKEDTTLIGRIERLVLKGAVQGAAGNFLFAWLQSLPRLFPGI
jgi:CheY-like chemotaxis protein